MQITITLDTDTLSSDQVSALGTLVGTGSAPAPKATPAAKAATKSTPAPKAEPETAPDPEAEEEPTDAPTRDDAVALATKLVSNGEAKKVKEALTQVGAKKVSEIPEDKVAEFLDALS